MIDRLSTADFFHQGNKCRKSPTAFAIGCLHRYSSDKYARNLICIAPSWPKTTEQVRNRAPRVAPAASNAWSVTSRASLACGVSIGVLSRAKSKTVRRSRNKWKEGVPASVLGAALLNTREWGEPISKRPWSRHKCECYDAPKALQLLEPCRQQRKLPN